MRLPAFLPPLILIFGLTVSASLRYSLASDGVAENAKPVQTRVYKVNDLPVWTSETKYDPSVLMRLIKASVSSSNWNPDNGDSTMAPYPQNASLIISTSLENHDKIVDLLESMRPKE